MAIPGLDKFSVLDNAGAEASRLAGVCSGDRLSLSVF